MRQPVGVGVYVGLCVYKRRTFKHFMAKTRVINIPVSWGKLYIIPINRRIKTNENNAQLLTNIFLTIGNAASAVETIIQPSTDNSMRKAKEHRSNNSAL